MNSITLIGRLGRDAEVRATANGKKFISFSMAVDEKQSDNTMKTDWYSVNSYISYHYGKFAEYLTKGKPIMVVGRLRPGIYIDKAGQAKLDLNVVATDISFLSFGDQRKDENATTATPTTTTTPVVEERQVAPTPQPTPTPAPVAATPQPNAFNQVEAEDDLPF